MYVVTWEPRGGLGGHQLSMDRAKAERIGARLARSRPDCAVRVISTEALAAEAVKEHGLQMPHRQR